MPKPIQLTRGLSVVVDDEDYENLNQFKWCVLIKKGNTPYAKRDLYENAHQSKTILMHRVILNAPQTLEVDHIDGNGLNNQRSNLRLVTHYENQQNRHPKKEIRGVSWHKATRKWRAYITINGKQRHLGLFKIEEQAVEAYKSALKR